MPDYNVSAPVRSCCGHRHHGATCPDGKVMCCICFKRVDKSLLAEEKGAKVNVCLSCKKSEREAIERRLGT